MGQCLSGWRNERRIRRRDFRELDEFALSILHSTGYRDPAVGHTIKGWLMSGPTIGEPLVIDRTERNGITVRGLFVSSPVVIFDSARIQVAERLREGRASKTLDRLRLHLREIQPPRADENSSD